jgi:hypothetical protein
MLISTENGGGVTDGLAVSFKQFHAAANYLNNVSDALGKAIGTIESRLRKLKLGVEAWTELPEATTDSGYSFIFELGYKDGLRIRTFVKKPCDEEYVESENRPFNDVPRHIRLRVVPKIPDLIQELRRELEAKAAEVKPIVDQANAFAEALDLALQSQDGAE